MTTHSQALADAFDELRDLGWWAVSDLACCQNCGWAAFDEYLANGGPEPPVGVVFWHGQDQDMAFEQQGALFAHSLDGPWVEEREDWTEEDHDQFEYIDILYGDDLIDHLHMSWAPRDDRHWRSALSQLCSTLERHGLTVMKPKNKSKRVMVLPEPVKPVSPTPSGPRHVRATTGGAPVWRPYRPDIGTSSSYSP